MVKKKIPEKNSIKQKKIDPRIMSKKLKAFIEKIRQEGEKFGLISQVDEENHTIIMRPTNESHRFGINIIISTDLGFLSIHTPSSGSLILNPYILDFFDIFTNKYQYQLSSCGFHSGANDHGLIHGTLWGIMKKVE